MTISVERVLTDASDEEVDNLMKDFESAGCTGSKEKQPDEKWTFDHSPGRKGGSESQAVDAIC
jgi:hypothetical protein